MNDRLLNAQRREAERVMSRRAFVRMGIITSYDPNNYAAKVQIQPEGHETGWLPIHSPAAGNGYGFFFGPSIGDVVEVHYQEGGKGAPFIGLRQFGDRNRPVAVQSGEFMVIQPSGGFIKLKNDGTLAMQDAHGSSIALNNDGTSTLNGDLTANGNLNFNAGNAGTIALTAGTMSLLGNLAVQGAISATEGIGSVSGSGSVSGTNTGDQTISLTGDVTGSGTGTFAATIGANKVTYGKIQQETAQTLLGNPGGSAGNVQEITLGTGLAFSGSTLTAVGTPVVEVTATSATLAANTRYIVNCPTLCTLTLPTTIAQGAPIYIDGKGAGGWKVAQNAGQTIHTYADTTTGVAGSLSSSARYDNVALVCITANTDFEATARNGSLVVV